MTTPAVRTMKRGNSRYYIHPVTKEKAVGVTSVVNMLPKDFLRFWSAKVVAEKAVSNLAEVIGMVSKGQPEDAIQYLKRAPMQTTDVAAVKGTEVHAMTEEVDLLGGIPSRIHKDLLPYARGYLAFREETEAEIVEVETTIWSKVHGYSGTLDRSILIPDTTWSTMEAPPEWYEGPAIPILGDVKTTRSGVHAEVALQLAAYRAAEEKMVVGEDGEFTPAPWARHSTTGLVIHLRPDSWKLVPVEIGPEVFDIFKALLVVFTWDKELKDTVLHNPIAGVDTWDPDEVLDLEKVIKQLTKTELARKARVAKKLEKEKADEA
jgi:hypothetical protein